MKLAGKNSSELKSEIIQDFVCPKCNSQNVTTVSVYGTFKHLFTIPFLAGKPFGTSNCKNCNQKFQLSNMPDTIKLAYFELKETTKTPIWYYSGIISIKVLVLIKIFSKYI